MVHTSPSNRSLHAFTLVELAIVLVVIGLIIGAILTQRDLTRSAEVRGQISQLERMTAAFNTFRTKYNAIPGDASNATQLFDTNEWPDVRNGNGNRQIEVLTSTASNGLAPATGTATYRSVTEIASPDHIGEVLQFWHQLTAAELIDGQYNGKGGAGGAATENGRAGYAFPSARMGGGVGVFSEGARIYLQIGVLDGVSYRTAPAIQPIQAYNIDAKMDDGSPTTGGVTLRNGQQNAVINTPISAADVNAGGGSTNACIEDNITPLNNSNLRTATYGFSNENVACSLRIRVN